MSTGVDHVLPATRTAPRRGRLGHGRTWILASGDLLALTVAYVLTYVAADMLGPLPPVSAPSWFLTFLVITAVPIWLAIFTGYGLYEADALQISVSSFDEVREHLPRDARRVARVPDPLAGRPLSLRLVGVHGRRGGALHQRLARPRPGAARLDPLVGLPAGHGAAPHADRRRRRRGPAGLPQARRASRVRPRGRRVPGVRRGRRSRPRARRVRGRRAARRRARDRPRDHRDVDRRPRADARPAPHACGGPTSRSPSSRATSRSSPRRRPSTTSRACRS